MECFDENISMVRQLSPEQLLETLNRQLAYVRANSSFYREHLPDILLGSMDEFSGLPFVTPKDIIKYGRQMLCCPAKQVRRMVTMQTSGTTGESKRLAFSERDLQDTAAFFRDGMHLLCGSGDTVMIFMPGSRQDGLCQLLAEGIRGFGGIPVIYGVISDYQEAAQVCRQRQPAVMVGIPAQIRRLALTAPDLRPNRVLLSADYLALSLAESIERVWRCQVLNHYGMTESGLGCAVETPERKGMLVRRDIYLETLPDGELALTTLRRQAMPLIRYRTGDLGQMLENGRLGEIYGRKSDLLQDGSQVSITRLDQLLFSRDAILDYRARREPDGLYIIVAGGQEAVQAAREALLGAGVGIPYQVEADDSIASDGISKRKIHCNTTAAIITAAGLSSRMGDFKPLLPLGDTTVIGQAVSTLKQAGVSPIIAVTGREAERLRRYLAPMGVECVHNAAFAATDMFRSACLGMERLQGRGQRFFFLPVDIPLFTVQTLKALAAHMDRTGCGMAQPVCDGRKGHPILLDAALLPALLSYTGEDGLRGAIRSSGIQPSCIPVADKGVAMDADTPEDYQKLLCYYQKRSV